MTNEELKKKICDIIAPYVSAYGDDERIADALIAAGIGDVSGLKNHRIIAEYSLIPEDGNSCFLPDTPLRITQLYSGEEVEKIVKERDEYKHRAEVAEMALKKFAENITCEDCPFCGAERRGKMICPNCGSNHVTVQAVAEQKKRSCLMSCLWLLLAICTCGLILLIPLLTRKGSKTKSYAICQNCGYKWRV